MLRTLFVSVFRSLGQLVNKKQKPENKHITEKVQQHESPTQHMVSAAKVLISHPSNIRTSDLSYVGVVNIILEISDDDDLVFQVTVPFDIHPMFIFHEIAAKVQIKIIV